MLIVFAIICILIITVAKAIEIEHRRRDEYFGTKCACYIALGLIILFGVSMTNFVVDSRFVDSKIAMYQDENAKIETQIAEAVERHMQHETDVFTSVKPESSMTLVAMYPELKSDKLVESQINTYVWNNNKIKELKEQKINAKTARWWLYFGG